MSHMVETFHETSLQGFCGFLKTGVANPGMISDIQGKNLCHILLFSSPVAYCLLPVACCLLPVACCLLPNGDNLKGRAFCQVPYIVFDNSKNPI